MIENDKEALEEKEKGYGRLRLLLKRERKMSHGQMYLQYLFMVVSSVFCIVRNFYFST